MPTPAITPSVTYTVDAGRATAYRFAFPVERAEQVRVERAPVGTTDFAELDPGPTRDYTVDGDLGGIVLTATPVQGQRIRISRDTRIERQTGFATDAYARGPAAQVAFDNVVSILEELAAQTGYTGDPARAIVGVTFASGTLSFAHQDGTRTTLPLTGVLSSDFSAGDVTALKAILTRGVALDPNAVAKALWGRDATATNAAKFTGSDLSALENVVQAINQGSPIRNRQQLLTVLGWTGDANELTDRDLALLQAIVDAGGVDALLTEGELPEEVQEQAGRVLTMLSQAVLHLFAATESRTYPYLRADAVPFPLNTPTAVSLVGERYYSVQVGIYDAILVASDAVLTTLVVDLTTDGVPVDGVQGKLQATFTREAGDVLGLSVSEATTNPASYQVVVKTLGVPAPHGTTGEPTGAAGRAEAVAIDTSAGNETPAVNSEGELVFDSVNREVDRRVLLPRMTVKDAQDALVGGLDAVKELRLRGGLTATAVDAEVVELTAAAVGEQLSELRKKYTVYSGQETSSGPWAKLGSGVAVPADVLGGRLILRATDTGLSATSAEQELDLTTFHTAAYLKVVGQSPGSGEGLEVVIGTDRFQLARDGAGELLYASNDHGVAWQVDVEFSRIAVAETMSLPPDGTTNVNLSVDQATGQLRAIYHGDGLTGGLDQTQVRAEIDAKVPDVLRSDKFPDPAAGDDGEFLRYDATGDAFSLAPASVTEQNVYDESKNIIVAGTGTSIATNDATRRIAVSAGVPSVLRLPRDPHTQDRVRLLRQDVFYGDRQMVDDEAASGPTYQKWNFPDPPTNGPQYIEAYSAAHDNAARRGKAFLVTAGTFNMPADLQVAYYRRGTTRNLLDVSDAPLTGTLHWYELSGTDPLDGRPIDFSTFDATETQFSYDGNWQSATLNIPNGYYPSVTFAPGDYTFVGGHAGAGSYGWIPTPDGVEAEVLASWRVDGIHSGTTSLTTPAAASTWSPWRDLVTATLGSDQEGEAIIAGHIHAVSRTAASGGDRFFCESRVQRRRGAATETVADDIDYGPRNLGDPPGRNDYTKSDGNPTDLALASRVADKNLLAMDSALGGDVYTLQIRVTAQAASRILDLNVTGNTLIVASRAGVKGAKGDTGPRGASGDYTQYTTAQWAALSAGDKAALTGLVVVT